MGMLADHVSVRALAARSVNLERDSEGDDLTGYVPTARSVDTLRRVIEGLTSPVGTRAWSVTGPYGSGKSSFALMLDSLCGPDSDARGRAMDLVATSAPDVAKRTLELVEQSNGLIRATTVATIEPVTSTLRRALCRGVSRRWPSKVPRTVEVAIRRLSVRADIAAIKESVDVIAGYAPVLIVVDEFGKNLEYHATTDPGELFALQELAERFSGECGHRSGGLLTLQHLAFEDYASALSTTARREWAKVQGRFEDIPFVDSPDQIVRLIADTIRHEPSTKAMALRLAKWAEQAGVRTETLGLVPYLGSVEMVGRCYPLHPIAAVALPDLCSHYGQYERTLVAFLASGEPESVVSFCADNPDTDPLPTVGLVELYDYFVTAARTLTGAAAGAARWLEVETRINDALVDDDDLELLKIIGVLNLVSGNGPLRANSAMVTFAADLAGARAAEIGRRLAHLAERGVVTFRAFADEYRLWNGTDFDVSGAIADSRELLSMSSPAALLSDAVAPTPVIAGRHSQRTGILRYFDVVYADSDHPIELPVSRADGALVYVVAGSARPIVRANGQPVVIASTQHISEAASAALELAAIRRVLRDNSTVLATDWVARRELQERAAHAHVDVSVRLAAALDPSRDGVRWTYDGEAVTSRRGPSGALSLVCDKAFSSSPTVRNEMIARRELTSQGAKARRVLMEAMLKSEEATALGLDGYGPERAIYHAVLEQPGFHRSRSDGQVRFGPPKSSSDWEPAWRELLAVFTEAEAGLIAVDQIYKRLRTRPFGVKDGVVPILLTVGLLYRRHDVAIYEDGTYQPKLSADLLERMVRNPDRFALKNFAASAGTRLRVIERLATELKVDVTPTDRRRNSTILALMAPLLGTIRELPEFTLKTRDMDSAAVAVRDALVSARQPDEMLFRDLPIAVGLNPDSVAAGERKSIGLYAERLGNAIRELQQNWPTLLAKIESQLRTSVATPPSTTVRADLAARAHHLVDRVLDPRLKAFLVTASEVALDQDDWLEAVALTAVDKPVRSWRDHDWPAFVASAVQLGGTLKRLEALNYEHIAQGSTEFSARRFTITNPDGTETSAIIVSEPGGELAVEAFVGKVVEQARQALPSGALPAFVARMTEELLLLSSEPDTATARETRQHA